MIVALLMLACSGDESDGQVSVSDTGVELPCESLTWEATGEPFVTTWCTGCHSSELAADARYGAPVSVNLDRYDDVVALAARVEATSVGAEARMPPVGGGSDADKALFARWLECGMPGPPDPEPAGCEAAVEVSVFGGCDGGLVKVVGDFVVAGDGDCVCSVGGSLSGTGELPVLMSVGGDVRVTGAFSAPVLLSIGGDLTVDGANDVLLPRLQTAASVLVTGGLAWLDLHDLETVAGDVQILDNPSLTTVDLSRLADVGGTLALADNPSLEVVLGEGYAMRHIGGDLLLQRNASWVGFYGFGLLETVGGDLIVSEQDRFAVVNGFTALTSVGGDVRIASNASLGVLEGFDQLTDIGGELSVSANRKLSVEDAFGQLAHVDGAVIVSGNTELSVVSGLVGVRDVGGVVWSDHPRLVSLGGYANLQTVRGDVSIRGMGALQAVQGFVGLQNIEGALLVENNPVLVSVPGLASVRSVGGRVEVLSNAQLQGLVGLGGIEAIGANLRIIDNPLLSEAALQPWLSAVVVSGSTDLQGNAE